MHLQEPSSEDTNQSRTGDKRKIQKYLTLLVGNASLRKAFARALSTRTILSSDPHVCFSGTSTRSHTHGTNRDRIVLHVALSGRRKFARRL